MPDPEIDAKAQPESSGPLPSRNDSEIPPRRTKRGRMLLALSLLIIAFFLTRHALTPGPRSRTEIAPGVFLEVLQFNQPETATGIAMVAEIHWDTPGLEIITRPLDPSLASEGKHHRLSTASWEILRNSHTLLLNGTLHFPATWHDNYPGAPVSVNETVVSNGRWSHVHEHTYLIWWDADGNGHCETRKPPSVLSQQKAVTGIGTQGIIVAEGKVRHNVLGGNSNPDSQSFIGIDPQRKILWLIAFQNATPKHVAETAASLGVQFGGRVDGGDSTTLVIGPAAKHVFPFTGLRHTRFLGNYIAIRSKPN